MIDIRVRDRSIAGKELPLSAVGIVLRRGDTVAFRCPCGHILPHGVLISQLGWSLKSGSGFSVANLAIGLHGASVEGSFVISDFSSDTGRLGIRLTLTQGDTWEINIPMQAA